MMISVREATVIVKAALEATPIEDGINDLIILGIEVRDDLWVFKWNNPSTLIGEPFNEYPGCDPYIVFKDDGTLIQLDRFYGWVDGAYDQAIESARNKRQKR